jgi:hypothetical protein
MKVLIAKGGARNIGIPICDVNAARYELAPSRG